MVRPRFLVKKGIIWVIFLRLILKVRVRTSDSIGISKVSTIGLG